MENIERSFDIVQFMDEIIVILSSTVIYNLFSILICSSYKKDGFRQHIDEFLLVSS